jgi:hypothetical protein
MRHLALLSVLVPTLLLAAEREYPLKIFRPDTAGMRFKVSVAVGGRYEITRTVRNQPAPPEEHLQATQLDATAEILEASAEGHDLKIKYTVERFVKVLEDGQIDLLPAGRTFTAELKPRDGGKDAGKDDHETRFSLSEGELTEDLKEQLGLVAHLPAPDTATPDALYLPKAPQKIGATWQPNADALAKEYLRGGWKFSPDDVKGSVKLVGLDRISNREALNLSAEWRVDKPGFVPRKEWRVGNLKLASAGPLEVKYDCLVPTDTAALDVTASGSTKSTLLFKSPDDASTLQYKTTRQWEVHATLVKK